MLDMEANQHNDNNIISWALNAAAKKMDDFSDIAEFRNKDMATLGDHNLYYNTILASYAEAIKTLLESKNKKKECFYRLSVGILCSVTIFFILCLSLSFSGVIKNVDNVGLLTALGAFISTYMVIPHAITKYLFNEKEEENMARIIENIQNYDSKIRDNLSK